MAGFCERGNEPSGSIKKAGFFLTSWVTISFSNNILHHGVSNCSAVNSYRGVEVKLSRNYTEVSGQLQAVAVLTPLLSVWASETLHTVVNMSGIEHRSSIP